LHGIKNCFVTFDQPLYIKAAEIVAASTDLSNVVVRLGGSHLLMSYLGSIGFIMGGSGTEAMWETVYAAGTVTHMLTGHAYARAHLLTSAALSAMLLLKHDQLDDDQREKLCSLHKLIMNEQCSTDSVLGDTAMQQAMTTIANLMDEEKKNSQTESSWISYMEQVSLMKMFLYAERTGNWTLYLQCVRRMLPYFHAAGHLAYAKSARLYLQQMNSLESKVTETENIQLVN